MIQFRQSIGFRLLVISFILLALPLLVDAFILVRQRYSHAIADAKANLVENAHFKQLPVDQLNPINRPLVDLFIDNLNLQGKFPTESDQSLNAQLKKLKEIGGFFGIFLLKITPDNQYIVTATSNAEFLGRDYTNFFKLNDLFLPKSLEKGYASYLSFDDKNLHPFFIVAHPVFSLEEGRYVGVIAISNDIYLKLKALLEPTVSGYTINYAILLPSSVVFQATDPDLRFQYFSPLDETYKKLFQEEAPTTAQKLPNDPLVVSKKSDDPFFEFTWKGHQQIGYIEKLPNANYSILAYADKTAIFQAPLLEFFNVYVIYGIILIIGGSLATIMIMRMAKPIQNLGLVMQKLQAGEMTVRYSQDPLGFEINTLGQIFNEMIDALLGQKRVAEEERVKRETLAQELRLGRQVQRSLLPQSMPEYPGVEVAETYIPTIEVSGDFFDVFIKDEPNAPKLVLAIADVSGKGVQACFYSLSVRNMLRAYTKEYLDIAEAMNATNDLFRLDTAETSLFVTALCGVYDHQTKILNYYSCGHNPGLVRRQNGEIEILATAGMAMGVFPSQKAKASSIQLAEDDVVVFYTDGVTEAHDVNDALFTEERLIAFIKQAFFKSAEELANKIVNEVNSFATGAPQHDDITLLVMRVKKHD